MTKTDIMIKKAHAMQIIDEIPVSAITIENENKVKETLSEFAYSLECLWDTMLEIYNSTNKDLESPITKLCNTIADQMAKNFNEEKFFKK
jgi:hypothetical protein